MKEHKHKWTKISEGFSQGEGSVNLYFHCYEICECGVYREQRKSYEPLKEENE